MSGILGNNIREVRKEIVAQQKLKGVKRSELLTQEKLAQVMGVSKSLVQKVETEQVKASDLFIKIFNLHLESIGFEKFIIEYPDTSADSIESQDSFEHNEHVDFGTSDELYDYLTRDNSHQEQTADIDDEKLKNMLGIGQESTPKHPGFYLGKIVNYLQLSIQEISTDLNCDYTTIKDLVGQKRTLSNTMALKLSVVIGGSVEFWFWLQSRYSAHLECQKVELIKSLKRNKYAGRFFASLASTDSLNTV